MRLERIIDVRNVGAGKTAIITLPLGPTYEALHLDLNDGLLISDLETVTGKIDGKPFFTATGPDLAKQINYDGYGLPTTKLTLDFTLPHARSQGSPNGPTSQAAEMLLTCLPSARMQSLTFEIKIAAAADVDSTISALMQIAEPSENPFVIKQFQTDQSFSAANTHSILLPTGEAGGMLERLYLHTSGAGSITNVELKNNGVTILEATPEEIQYIQQYYYGKTIQANQLVLDFHLQGLRSKLFNTVVGRNTYMKLTTSGAMDLRLYSRFIDPINRQ